MSRLLGTDVPAFRQKADICAQTRAQKRCAHGSAHVQCDRQPYPQRITMGSFPVYPMQEGCVRLQGSLFLRHPAHPSSEKSPAAARPLESYVVLVDKFVNRVRALGHGCQIRHLHHTSTSQTGVTHDP